MELEIVYSGSFKFYKVFSIKMKKISPKRCKNKKRKKSQNKSKNYSHDKRYKKDIKKGEKLKAKSTRKV